MKKYSSITGVILAGGKSRRMGQDKALLEYEGKPLIQHVAEALRCVFKKVIIISDHGKRYKFLGLPVHEDSYKHCGPLGGIHAAFARTKTEKIFVASCDLPLLSSQTVLNIVTWPLPGDAVVVRCGRSIQPLCGVYSRSSFHVLERHLKRGQLSVLQFLENLSTFVVTSQATATCRGKEVAFNINTPDDYHRLLRNATKKKDNVRTLKTSKIHN